jgi:hypothetical protein
MGKLNVKTTDCSYKDLLRIAQKCGFIFFQSAKHCKIKSVDNQFIAMIPRHNTITKGTVKGILEAFNKFGAEIIIS